MKALLLLLMARRMSWGGYSVGRGQLRGRAVVGCVGRSGGGGVHGWGPMGVWRVHACAGLRPMDSIVSNSQPTAACFDRCADTDTLAMQLQSTNTVCARPSPAKTIVSAAPHPFGHALNEKLRPCNKVKRRSTRSSIGTIVH